MRIWSVALTVFLFSGMAHGTPYSKTTDIEYASVEEVSLKLDLYLPKIENPRLLVWVHGGAWRSGSKDFMPLEAIVEAGFAIASVDYRLSTQAPFPALIHDIKASIRFLRAKQKEYGYDASRVAIAGNSAGGHLVALVGTTNGDKELEGKVGEHLDESSDVQAIVSYYGASNLTTILDQSTPHGLSVRVPALKLLFGGPLEERMEVAHQASPVFHVDPADPPLYLIHGDQDPQMPINQAHELHGKYKALKLPVEFEMIHGAAHGGDAFYDKTRNRNVLNFLSRHLKSTSPRAAPATHR